MESKDEALIDVNNQKNSTSKFTTRTCKSCKKKYVHTYKGFDAIMERESLIRKCDDCMKDHCVRRGPKPKPVPLFVECDICGERFSRKILIYVHMDKHRAPEELSCRVCHSKFSRRNTLRMHLRIHFESHVCEQCGFKTANRISLKKHLQTHKSILNNTDLEIPTLKTEERMTPKTSSAQGNFPCSYCGLIFKTKGSLFGHEKRQHLEGTNSFKCKYCNAILFRQKEFRLHVLSHSKKPLLFCHFPNCDIYFDSLKLLNRHIRMTHKSADDFEQCKNCNKQFKYKSSLAKHLKSNRCLPLSMRKNTKFKGVHQAMTPEQLEMAAKIAKEQYLEIRGLSKIIEKEPDDEEDVFQENNLEVESVVTKSEPLMFDDDNNSRIDSFMHNENDDDVKIDSLVKIEIKTEPIEDQEMINESIENSNTSSKMESSDDDKPIVSLEHFDLEELPKRIELKEETSFLEPKNDDFHSFFELPVESKSNSSRIDDDTLGRKKRKYSKKREISYRCKFCTERFARKLGLHDHINQFHTKDQTRLVRFQKYTCDLCGKDFISLSSIRDHINVVHTTNVYCCTFCGKRFKRYADVHEHERRHADPVACHICGKLVKALDAHIKSVHSEKKKDEMLPCTFCGKLYNKYAMKSHINNIHLKLHIATTFDRPCLKCGMKFPRQADLTKHDLLTHFDGSIKYCTYEECDKMFKSIKLLNRHIKRMHFNTSLDYTCEKCGKTYQSLDGLKKHLRKHNK